MGIRIVQKQASPFRTVHRLIRRCGVAAFLIGSACASADTASTSDLGDAASASGVGVLAVGCGPAASAGSGVTVGAPGQVVTVAHTVAGATSITVVTEDGTKFNARVVAFDPAADLAVLAVTDLTTPPLAVGSVQLGDATLVSWSTDSGIEARPVEVTQRLAITIDDIYGAQSATRSGFEIAGDIVVGDSGGPVVSPDGDVIGIVYARSRSRSSTAFATDANEVNKVLDAVGNEPVDNGTCV